MSMITQEYAEKTRRTLNMESSVMQQRRSAEENTFEYVKDVCKLFAEKSGVEVVFDSKDLVDCFGKNQAVQSDGQIILGEYDSPEMMALCFAHEMSHVYTSSAPHDSKFSYEWAVWGKTFDNLYKMFGIYPTKELAEHALKCVSSYVKDEHLLHV